MGVCLNEKFSLSSLQRRQQQRHAQGAEKNFNIKENKFLFPPFLLLLLSSSARTTMMIEKKGRRRIRERAEWEAECRQQARRNGGEKRNYSAIFIPTLIYYA
jgi:hypothetical protein